MAGRGCPALGLSPAESLRAHTPLAPGRDPGPGDREEATAKERTINSKVLPVIPVPA